MPDYSEIRRMAAHIITSTDTNSREAIIFCARTIHERMFDKGPKIDPVNIQQPWAWSELDALRCLLSAANGGPWEMWMQTERDTRGDVTERAAAAIRPKLQGI